MKQIVTICLLLLASFGYLTAQSSGCERATIIECGKSVQGNNIATSNSLGFQNYGNCMSGLSGGIERNPFDGNDVTYRVTVEESDLSISLTGLSADLDIFVFRNCVEGGLSNCFARSINSNNSSESINIENANGTYYIVVDAQFAASRSAYTLRVDCGDIPTDPCAEAQPIRCDQEIASDNFTQSSQFDRNDLQGCVTGFSQYTARDRVFKFDVPNGTDQIKVDMKGLSSDLDLFVFQGSCTPGNCIKAGINNGTNDESFTLGLVSGTLYFIVDGKNSFNSSRFNLKVTCVDPCEDVNTDDSDCDLVDFDYTGTNGALTYRFSVPSNIPSGTWTGQKGFSTIGIGSGRNITYTFGTTGAFEICYFYNNSDGCRIKCCKTIYIEDPYDCDRLTSTPNGNNFTLAVPGLAASNVLFWRNDDTNTTINNSAGKGSISVPKPAAGQCAQYSVFFFDPGVNAYRICCIRVCNTCETQKDQNCDQLNFNYIGSNGSLRYQFSVPNNLPSGTWTAQRTGGNAFGIGSGRTVSFTFSAGGEYEICYKYTNSNGCEILCCRTIFIENPYDCDQIFYSFNSTSNRYELTIPGIPAANILSWTDDDNNSTIGTGTTVTVPIGAACTVRRFSVRFLDPATNCYRICCIAIYICDPYDCNKVTATQNSSNYTLTLPGVPATNIVRWENDDTRTTVPSSANRTAITVPKPGPGLCARYSVFFYDPGVNAYRICCIRFCQPDNCPAKDPNCDNITFQYIGSNGSLRYQFSVPNSLPSGTWTAQRTGGSAFGIGSGRTVSFTFSAGGEYEICYKYTNSQGCEVLCCKTIFIEDPYDCDRITYSYDRNTQLYTLTIPGIPAGNIVQWQDDQTGQVVGTGTSITVPINSTCELRLFSVIFLDPATNCYRICCLRIFICDPYDCDDITATENATNYTLSIPGIPAANILRWQDDQTLATIATNTNSVNVPKPAAGQCAYYSVFFLDPATNCYRVCCIKICNNNCQPDLDCDLVDFNYSGQNGSLRYTFSVPTGTPSGTWSVSGGQYGNNGFNIGTGLTTSFTFPSVGTYTVCYTYTDADGCEKQCCKTICIAGDPYDCDLIQKVYDANSNTWTLSVPNVSGTRVAFWQNDITLQQFGQGQLSVSVPNPPAGQCGYYSVKVYDPACGGYKLCCLRICNTGCGSVDIIDVKCTDDDDIYDLLLSVANSSGRPNVDAEFTILSPIGVTFQSCQSYLKVSNIGTGINPALQLEGCLVPLTAGMTVTFKVSLVDSDPTSTWCCHLDPITVTIPECEDCLGEPQPDLICATVVELVCGCDGKTYGNECEALRAGVQITTPGECPCQGTPKPDLICTDVYTPVCGCDGMTYSNECYAEAAGISSWTPGECCTTCTDDPLNDLPWLGDLPTGTEIIEYKLDDKCVYTVTDCVPTDALGTIYDCFGNEICIFGGIGGFVCDEFSQMRFQRVIRTCPTNNATLIEARTEGKLSLSNFPNPFSNSTTIAFTLPTRGAATIEIFDTNGKVVYTQTNDYTAGEHQLEVNTANQLSAGVYYYRLSTGEETMTKTMMILE